MKIISAFRTKRGFAASVVLARYRTTDTETSQGNERPETERQVESQTVRIRSSEEEVRSTDDGSIRR
jgi:hypothetical protein